MAQVQQRWFATIERGEQIAFIVLYAHLLLTFSLELSGPGAVILLLYAFDQAIVLVFLLSRRPALEMSRQPMDYIVAVASTLLPLFAIPIAGPNLLPLPILAVTLLCGILLHFTAKLSLRRSFGILPANRGIKRSGAYRYVRHPMYLGYLIVQTSLVLGGPVAWNVVILAASIPLFILRISAEERLLSQSADYRAFCRDTPFRLIPGIY